MTPIENGLPKVSKENKMYTLQIKPSSENMIPELCFWQIDKAEGFTRNVLMVKAFVLCHRKSEKSMFYLSIKIQTLI